MVSFQSRAFAEDAGPGNAEVYKNLINPWIERWFKDHALEVDLVNNVRIERELVGKDLHDFEAMGGSKRRYTVRVLYLVNITDRNAKMKVWGLKEQKITFLVEGTRLKDYFPTEDSWRGAPRYSEMAGTVGI